jgi:hypothetical protein
MRATTMMGAAATTEYPRSRPGQYRSARSGGGRGRVTQQEKSKNTTKALLGKRILGGKQLVSTLPGLGQGQDVRVLCLLLYLIVDFFGVSLHGESKNTVQIFSETKLTSQQNITYRPASPFSFLFFFLSPCCAYHICIAGYLKSV